MTRHQRRKLAERRRLSKAIRLANVMRCMANVETTRDNLGSPKRGERTPSGLVSSIYSGAANPLGYTRPLRFTKGAAK